MIVVAKLKAKSGEESKMAEALQAMVSKVEKEEGTLIYTLHQAQNDPTQFLFYEKYTSLSEIKEKISEQKDEIQCLVSEAGIQNEIPFGTAQHPELWDYADNVDTLAFLLNI